MSRNYKRTRWGFVGAGVVAALAIGSLALGQSSGQWNLSHSGVTAGGGTSAGLSDDARAYVVLGSIGETSAGASSLGGPYTMNSGILAANRALFRLLVILAAKDGIQQ